MVVAALAAAGATVAAADVPPPPGGAPLDAAGLVAVRALAEENPLVAVATAWRHASTVATAGSMPAGAAPQPQHRYALVLLGSDFEPSRGPRPSAAESRAFTREAFDALLRRVEPGGIFGWYAADETVFARGVLQVADLLEARRAPGGWGATAMAFRLPPASSLTYRYALLVSNGPWEAESAARVSALERTVPVQALFAPGVAPRGVWGKAAGAGAEEARDLLRVELSRRAGAWRNLSAATSQRPGFFDLERVAPAPLRAASGGVLLALLAALLLPHPGRRRSGVASAPPWPLPVMLAPPGAFVAAGVFAGFALGGRALALGAASPAGPLAVGIGVAAGAVLAARRRAALPAAAWAAALGGAVVAGAWHAGLEPAFTLAAASAPRLVLLVAAGVTAGIPAGIAVPSARATLATSMPDVAGTANVVLVLAGAAAVASAPWLVWWRGFPAVWMAAVACYAIGALTAALVGAPWVRAASA